MKTYYVGSLKWYIEFNQEKMRKAQQALVSVKRDLRTWAVGSANHTAALEELKKLTAEIVAYKKAIHRDTRLMRHPEVIRRSRIAETIEQLTQRMGLDADSVYCYGNVGARTGATNVFVRAEKEKDWNYYAKSCKFPKISYHISLGAGPDWDQQVEARGLAFLGGMITLEAKPARRHKKALALAESLNVELYEAAWARKERGYSAVLERGFIAVKRTSLGILPVTGYHSDSALAAVEGAHRKFQNLDVEELPVDRRDVPLDAVATWADADAVGACAPGVKNWCDTVGIDHTEDSVPLIDVIRGYYQKPAPEARAIILRVLRNHPVKKAA